MGLNFKQMRICSTLCKQSGNEMRSEKLAKSLALYVGRDARRYEFSTVV
jgi:hypothetical protein